MTIRSAGRWSRVAAAWLFCSTCVAWAAPAKPAKPTAKLTAKAPRPVPLGGTVQLEVTASGAAKDKPVTWSISDAAEGSVDAQGAYHAPATHKTPAKISVIAKADSEPPASVKVTVSLQAISVTAKAAKSTVALGGETQIEAKVAGADPSVAGVKYELSGDGAIDEKGHYTAPKSGKTPAHVKVKVTSLADPSKSATVSLDLAAISVTAKAAKSTVALGGETQIDAKVSGADPSVAGVKYELSGDGAIDEKGNYTAPKSGKTPAHATVKVTSVADPSKSAKVQLDFAAVAVSIKAPAKPVPVAGAIDLAANVSGAVGDAAGVTWSVGEGKGKGSIDAQGHFVAPATLKTPATIAVKATSIADPSKSASVGVPIAAASVAITPRAAKLELGGDATFAAQVHGADASAQKVTWSVEGGEKNGTIDDAGHYHPPATLGTPTKVTIEAVPAADPSKAATATIAFAPVKLAARAPRGALALGGEVKLEATLSGATGAATGVSWKVETRHGGTIDPDGTFHAPAALKTPATITVRVTSEADPSKSAPVSLDFPAVEVKLPAKGAPVELGGSADLAAEVSGAVGSAAEVSWSVEGKSQGTIDEKGHFTPPAQLETPATITVRATSKADPSKAATTQLAVPAIAVRVAPVMAEVALGGTAKLTAQVTNALGAAQNVVWSVVGDGHGTIDPDGTYHAPASGQTPAKVTVRAVSAADPSKSAEAVVQWPEVTVSVDPSTARAELKSQLALRAKVESAGDTGVTWSVEQGVGSVSPEGRFTAPALLPEPPRAQITATSRADPSKHATAAVELEVADQYSVASEQRISGGQPGTLLAGAPSPHRVVIDGKRVMAAYKDGQAIFIASSDDRGRTWAAPKKLLTAKTPVAAPQLAVGPDHTLWLAYRAQSKGQPGDVILCRTPDLQHAFDPCVKANGKAQVANLAEHALAVAQDGSVEVAWHDGAVVTLARTGNRGASFSTQTFAAPQAHGLALTTSRDGEVFLAFDTTDRDTDELHLLSGKAALEPVKGLAVTGAHLEWPSVVARDAQHAALAYVDTGVVKVALVNGPATIVDSESGATQDFPALALEGDDGLQLAWREKRPSGEAIELARARHALSVNKLDFDRALSLSTPGPAVRGAPSLAIDAAGRASVAWTDGRAGDAQGTHQDLYLARLDDHPVQLQVTAPSKPLLAGETAQLQAQVSGSEDTQVRWVIDDGPGRGSVDARGVYTAPARLTGSPHVYVRAVSAADPTRSAAALVELAPQPEIASFSPEQCGLGEVVTLTGHHFGARYPGFGVTFGGVRAREADFVSWDDEKIAVRVPPGAKSGKVEVTAAGGTTTAAHAFGFLPVEVSVAPAYAIVYPGQNRSFVATVRNAGDTRVRWSLLDSRAGQLSADGTVSVASAEHVVRTRVRAASEADPQRSAEAQLVTGPLGGTVWSARLPGAHGPAIVDGRVIVTGQDGTARAFDRDGAQLWSSKLVNLDAAEGRPPQLRTPVRAGGEIVIVVQSSGSCAEGRACLPDTGELVAIDPASGAVAWRADLGDGDFTDAVAFPGGVAVARYAGALLAFKQDSGKKLWRVALPKGLSTPPVLGADGLLHGSGDGGVLYAVTASGKARPTVTFPGSPTSVSRPAVAADGTTYVTSDDGQLRAIDAKGKVRWMAALGGRVPPRTDSAPLLAGDSLYVATATTLEAFDLAGARRWKSTCGACSGPVLAGPDGTLYAGRYAPQAFSAEGAFLWGGDAPSEGERWSPGATSDEGLLFWTDAQGLSGRLVPPHLAPAPAAEPKGRKVTQR